MPILPLLGLLADKHLNKSFAVLVCLELFEERLLGFGHRTADAMTRTFVLANVDARAWRLRGFAFGHLHCLANKPDAEAPDCSWVRVIY